MTKYTIDTYDLILSMDLIRSHLTNKDLTEEEIVSELSNKVDNDNIMVAITVLLSLNIIARSCDNKYYKTWGTLSA